jgi:dipeptidyl aminopeptidase/acylaminoacyl peptidase
MKFRLVAALSFVAVSVFAAPSVSIEELLSTPFPTGLISAPSGRVAWIANAEGARNFWIAEPPDFQGRQLTSYAGDTGIEIGEASFTADSQSIVFTRGGDLDTGGENTNPTHDGEAPEQAVWIVSVRDGALRKIGEGNSPQVSPRGDRVAFLAKRQLWLAPLDGTAKPEAAITATGTRHTLRWSPDGTRIAFVSVRKEHSFIGVYDTTAKTIRYVDPGVDRDSFPVWSLDGKQLVFVRIPSRQETLAFAQQRIGPPWSMRLADANTGVGRELWRAGAGVGSVYRGVVAQDQLIWGAGDRIVFPWEKDGWTHLYAISLTGGAPQLLTPGEFEVEYVSSSPDRRDLIYNSNQNDIDRRHIWRVAVSGGPPNALTAGPTIEWSPRYSGANAIAFIRSDARMPPRPMIVVGSGAPREMTAVNVKSPSAQLVEPQQVIFTSADGMKIHAQLFVPSNLRAGEKRPAAVFFHGGSRRQMLLGWHYNYYYRNAYAMNQFLASRGYVVLSVNYRSGIGYGIQFREAESYGTRGASEVNDVIGAALYLRSRPDVDGDRIGAWGGSYGGYLTAFALAKASNLYAAGVDLHGVHDWNNEIKVWEPTYDPDANPTLSRLAWQSSPMAYVDTWRSPVLLIQGDDDRNVAFTETIHLAEALRKKGVDVELLVFPDEVHDFLLHRDWLTAYHAAADFFDRKLVQRTGN